MPKKILLASSEFPPLFYHQSDLADFTHNLASMINHLGHDVRVILPAYPPVLDKLPDAERVTTLSLSGTDRPINLFKWEQTADITCYLVDIPSQFNRHSNPYRSPAGVPWADNALFFGLFCRAIVAIALNQAQLSWQPDIVHCNNWQTGLVPAMLSEEWNRPATLFTLHSKDKLGYFDPEAAYLLGISETYLKATGLISQEQLSFVRGGLVFADWLAVPSRRFVAEIQADDFEQNLLTQREERLNSILSGVDYNQWNPITDEYISQQFDAASLGLKKTNKTWLQDAFGLPGEQRTLLLGYTGSLDDETISDLVDQLIPRLSQQNSLQLLISGSGTDRVTEQLQSIAEIYPGIFALDLENDKALQHRILAGCDALLIPESTLPSANLSMRSLIYGTIPIAKNLGGCADTLTDTNSSTRLNGLATSFLFDGTEESDQYSAISRALELYAKPRIWWEKLASSAMEKNFDLSRSTSQYLELYDLAIDNPRRNPLSQQQ